MGSASFLNRLIGSSGHLVHKIRAKDTTGRLAYYFVYVRPSREAEFLKAIEGEGTFDLEEYGDVLASCYGEAPDEATRVFLKERYGFSV